MSIFYGKIDPDVRIVDQDLEICLTTREGDIMLTTRLQSLLRILLLPVLLLTGLWPLAGKAAPGDIIRSFPSPN